MTAERNLKQALAKSRESADDGTVCSNHGWTGAAQIKRAANDLADDSTIRSAPQTQQRHLYILITSLHARSNTRNSHLSGVEFTYRLITDYRLPWEPGTNRQGFKGIVEA